MRENSPTGGSHLAVLIKAFYQTKGPILELGAGPFSTPVLHALAIDQERPLVTYENDEKYFERYSRFAMEGHKVIYVDDWDAINIDDEHWGLALVDHEPGERRVKEIRRLVHNTDIIVAHDSDEEHADQYRYEEIYPLFHYRKNFTKVRPNTAILSNKYGIYSTQ